MTSPRRTSMETRRGLDVRETEVVWLRSVTAGELMAVTMSHLCRWERIVESSLNHKIPNLLRASAQCQQFAINISTSDSISVSGPGYQSRSHACDWTSKNDTSGLSEKMLIRAIVGSTWRLACNRPHHPSRQTTCSTEVPLRHSDVALEFPPSYPSKSQRSPEHTSRKYVKRWS